MYVCNLDLSVNPILLSDSDVWKSEFVKLLKNWEQVGFEKQDWVKDKQSMKNLRQLWTKHSAKTQSTGLL